MNTKITRVLGLLFFICTFQLNAQIELFNGKSIRANEERQHTFKIKEWVNTPQTFNVLNPDGSNSKLSVDDAQEVIIPNYGHFISVSTSIEISSDLISQLSDKKESISENRTVFMEVLISGPVSLLKLKSEVNTRFYLKKDNDIQLLTYKKFKITDNQNDLLVFYQGILPDLFREGQGTVIEGLIENQSTINALSVYAKHDENYMPASIKEELEKNNQWKKDYK